MHTGNAEEALRRFAVAAGVDRVHVKASQLFDTMPSWYERERADNVVLEDGRDMLLFQWGTYDLGKGEMFEFDVTRQLIEAGAMGDDAILQLSWNLLFTPSTATSTLRDGNRWCVHPNELDSFRSFIRSSDVMRFAESHQAVRAELNYGGAG